MSSSSGIVLIDSMFATNKLAFSLRVFGITNVQSSRFFLDLG
jgi:hypothetical protein